jgi:DNA/RNA endonuclease YhcR with UshA esterase domain
MMKPDDPNNIQLISEGNAPAYVLTDPETFANGEVTVAMEEGTITESYAKLAMNTSVEIQNLYVLDAYTTKNEDSASKGAFTLYCRVNGIPITVRTVVLHDEEGNLVKQDAYMGRTINVKGIVDYFNGDYQIKVFSPKDITIVK